MFEITIPVAMLKAALLFAPAIDVRYYLKNVYFEAKEKRLVATNGHVLFWTRADICTVEGDAKDTLLPIDFLNAEIKGGTLSVNSTKLVIIKVQDDGTLQGNAAIGKAGEGRFPDWRRIVPAAAPLKAHPAKVGAKIVGGYNVDYLALLAKANKLVTGKKEPGYLSANYSDDGHMVVGFDNEANGIVMPWSVVPDLHPNYQSLL